MSLEGESNKRAQFLVDHHGLVPAHLVGVTLCSSPLSLCSSLASLIPLSLGFHLGFRGAADPPVESGLFDSLLLMKCIPAHWGFQVSDLAETLTYLEKQDPELPRKDLFIGTPGIKERWKEKWKISELDVKLRKIGVGG